MDLLTVVGQRRFDMLLGEAQRRFPVTRYGTHGDGTTDDTNAILAASAAAGPGGHLIFPPGRYVCSGDALTNLPAQQTWEGSGYQLGVGGTTTVTELRFTGLTGSQVGVVPGVNHIFKNILFRGPGGLGTTTAAIKSVSGHPRFYDCQFYSWPVATDIQNAYYSIYDRCEFGYNAMAIKATGCFNLDIISTRFSGSFANAGYFSDAVLVTDAIKHLAIIGGSIEGFSSNGGIQVPSDSLVDLFGVYFESSEATSASFGIVASGTGSTFNLFGNMVYLSNANRWFNASGLNGITVNARGNKFVCAASSVTSPIAYVLPANGSSGTVDLSGDDWADVSLAGASYVGGTLNSGPVKNKHIVPPSGTSAFQQEQEFMGRPILLPKLTAAPTTPFAGGIYTADNAGWDPLNRTGTDPYLVTYDGTRYVPLGHITFKNTATWDPPSIAAGAQSSVQTMTVTGAAMGDQVQLSFSLDLQGLVLTGYVSAANTVSYFLRNGTTGAVDLASGTVQVVVTRH